MEITIEAIEEDLRRAEATLGRPEAAIHMQRAQVRATLLALESKPVPAETPEPDLSPLLVAGSDIRVVVTDDVEVFSVPKSADDDDRITAAAMILGLATDTLRAILDPKAGSADVVEAPADPDLELDIDDDEDFFAEARRPRG